MRGFTAIELMVTVVVLGILLALAIPPFKGLYLDSQRSSAVNDLLADMLLARSESARLGQTVIICASSNGTSCGAASAWATGWLVFNDFNDNGALNDDDADAAIEEVDDEEIARRATGRYASMTVTGSAALFRFRPFNQATAGGNILFCDPRDVGSDPAPHSRTILIAPSGRPRADKVDSSGDPLDCT